jgi:hypothetical protein
MPATSDIRSPGGSGGSSEADDGSSEVDGGSSEVGGGVGIGVGLDDGVGVR